MGIYSVSLSVKWLKVEKGVIWYVVKSKIFGEKNTEEGGMSGNDLFRYLVLIV
jgi:hypothetical protein